jgi:hypothetical protein
MQLRTLFSLVVILTIGCNESNENGNKTNYSLYRAQNDSTCYISAVKNLLSWYSKKYDTLNSIQLVDMPSAKDSMDCYHVNFDSANKFIEILQSTNYFTKTYLDNMHRYFQKCETKLLSTRQKDGPPEGLEADLILFTQDPIDLLHKYKTMNITLCDSLNKATKTVKLETIENNLLFEVISISRKCQINNIQSQVRDN